MGYKKNLSEGKDVWTLLFPFDECHSLKFKYSLDGKDRPFGFVAHLARPEAVVTVSTDLATSSAGSDTDFDEHVLDLTSPKDWGTHAELKMVSGWKEKGALMTIENATFHVLDYFENENNKAPFLKGSNKTEIEIDKLAHHVYAEIDLGPTGILTIDAGGGKPLYESTPGTDALLWFDNDCEVDETITSDLDMLYSLAEDTDDSTKKFQVIGKPSLQPSPPNNENGADPVAPDDSTIEVSPTGKLPNLDKPCMFVKVGEPANLP